MVAAIAVVVGYYIHCLVNPKLWWSGEFGGTMVVLGVLLALGMAVWCVVNAVRRSRSR